jgi:hypothetical protein
LKKNLSKKRIAMKKLLLLITLVHQSVFAAPAPSVFAYLIQTLSGNVIGLTNGSQFTVAECSQATMLSVTWQANDSLVLLQNFAAFQNVQIQQIANSFVQIPNFILRNLSKGNSEVPVYLSTNPSSTPGTATKTINAIDLTNHFVTLSDSVNWVFPASSVAAVRSWEVGQFVLIGVSSALTPGFPSFIYNPVAQNYVVTSS